MISVYIASPYTIGDNFVNVQRQIDAANKLLDAGLFPYAPLVMSAPLHGQRPRTADEWMEYDYYWLDRCEVLLRLDGESEGADKEVARALQDGKTVCNCIDDLIRDYKSGVLDGVIDDARRARAMQGYDFAATLVRSSFDLHREQAIQAKRKEICEINEVPLMRIVNAYGEEKAR